MARSEDANSNFVVSKSNKVSVDYIMIKPIVELLLFHLFNHVRRL